MEPFDIDTWIDPITGESYLSIRPTDLSQYPSRPNRYTLTEARALSGELRQPGVLFVIHGLTVRPQQARRFADRLEEAISAAKALRPSLPSGSSPVALASALAVS